MSTNLEGSLMPPGNHTVFPCCSHSYTLPIKFTPSPLSKPPSPPPHPHSQLSTLIPYSLRLLKRKKTFTNSYCQSNPPTWWWVWDTFWRWNQQELEMDLMRGMGKRRHKDDFQVFAQILFSQQDFPLPPFSLCLSCALALSLSLTHTVTQSRVHTLSLSPFLFFVLSFFFSIPVITNWNTKHFTPLLNICLPLLEYNCTQARIFMLSSLLQIRKIVGTQ